MGGTGDLEETSKHQDVYVPRVSHKEGSARTPDEEDHMLLCVSYPLGYSAVLAAECLEVVDKVSEDVVYNGSLVNRLTLQFTQSLTYPSSIVKISKNERRLRKGWRKRLGSWSIGLK